MSSTGKQDGAHTKGKYEGEQATTCDLCSAIFSRPSNLGRHKQRVHGFVKAQKEGFPCPDPQYDTRDSSASVVPLLSYPRYQRCHQQIAECSENLVYRTSILSHLKKDHQYVAYQFMTELFFLTESDFYTWKEDEELRTCYQYVKPSGHRGTCHKKIIHFHCNRSGKYRGRPSNKRRLKAQGSCRMGRKCPATIIARVSSFGVSVEYLNYHPDHGPDLCHIRLTKNERRSIALRLVDGLSNEEMLQEIKSSRNSSRLKTIAKKDLINIRKEFELPPSSTHNANNEVTLSSFQDEVKQLCEKIANEAQILLSERSNITRCLFHNKLKEAADILSSFKETIDPANPELGATLPISSVSTSCSKENKETDRQTNEVSMSQTVFMDIGSPPDDLTFNSEFGYEFIDQHDHQYCLSEVVVNTTEIEVL